MPRIISCNLKRKPSGAYELGEYVVHYGTETLFPEGSEAPVVSYLRKSLPDFAQYDLDDWGCRAILYESWFFRINWDCHLLSREGVPVALYWAAPD